MLLSKRFLTELEKSSEASCFLLPRDAGGEPDKGRLGGIGVVCRYLPWKIPHVSASTGGRARANAGERRRINGYVEKSRTMWVREPKSIGDG